jgi:polysaccharide biosynthesis protein PslH
LKILIITPRIPYPPFRGDKLKIYNIAKILSANNTIKILTFLRGKKQLKDLEAFGKYGIQIETVKFSVLSSLLKAFIAIFSKVPFQVAWFSSVKMKTKINEELVKNNYDVVYYHLIRSSQYLNSADSHKVLSIADYTDAVSLYLTRFSEIEKNPFKKFLIKKEQKRVSNYEKIAEKFHTLFICSQIDKAFLEKKKINVRIKLLNNGIDTKYFYPDKINYEENRIIFTGNMPYYANYDAALYFVNDILPLILKEIPQSRFYIVGQKPPAKIKRLASENVVVTGFVKDIKIEYQKSAVNVAPMRFGAGTLNKVLESIALGVPVVATSIAVLGLPKELSKFIFVADNKEIFADTVLKILGDSSIRHDLMKEGQEIIKNKFSWERIVSDFENYLSNELHELK